MKYIYPIHVLEIGTFDSSPIGQLTRAMLLAITQFERDLISERTCAKLASLKAEGVKLGRPCKKADSEMRQRAQVLFEQGLL